MGEVAQAMRQSGGLYLTIALAFNVLPTVLTGLAMPTPPIEGQGSVVQMMLLTVVVLLGMAGWVAIQRLSLLGERVGEAVARAPLPTARLFGLVLLLLIPVAVLISPFIPTYQAGASDEQAAAATAIMLILLIAMFPLMRLLLALPVLAVERSGVFASIRRSWRLTRGNMFKLFGLALLFLVALGLITQAAQAAIGSVVLLTLGRPEPWSVSALLMSLLVQLAQLVVTLPFTILIARLYAQAVEREANVSVPHAGAE